MKLRGWAGWCLATLTLLPALAPRAVDGDTAFGRGRPIRVIVGYSVGGGFDVYTRVLARHLGRHVPGNPGIVVENMPGAGGLIAANHLYRIARPDGLTLGHFTGGLILGQVLGQTGIDFDARHFEYVGAPARERIACAVTRASGIRSVQAWADAGVAVKLGGTAPGAAHDNATRILRSALGLPLHLVTGYHGTADIRLAAESGELGGVCMNWSSMSAGWGAALKSGEVSVVVALTPQPIPELPGVPLAIRLAPTAETRRLIEVAVHDPSALARPYVLPPGTPPDRVTILRDAFAATLRDPEFLADAERARLEVDPVPGGDLRGIVQRLLAIDPALAARLRAILFD